MRAVWAGIDSGMRAHHCVVIDTAGRTLLSRRVVNDEARMPTDLHLMRGAQKPSPTPGARMTTSLEQSSGLAEVG